MNGGRTKLRQIQISVVAFFSFPYRNNGDRMSPGIRWMRQGGGSYGAGSMRRCVMLGPVGNACPTTPRMPLTGSVMRMMVAAAMVSVIARAGVMMASTTNVVMATEIRS